MAPQPFTRPEQSGLSVEWDGTVQSLADIIELAGSDAVEVTLTVTVKGGVQQPISKGWLIYVPSGTTNVHASSPGALE